jgi:MFS superfamily sulfate permease-like transporter
MACKWWATRIPGVLIAVVSATAIVWLLEVDTRSSLSVIGPLPQGLPSFQTPIVSVADFRALLSGALAVALVSFADMSVLSRTYAQRGGYNVDANQELIALGVANLATGLFQGFPVSSSASRTPVAESAGAKTQIAGLVGASCIAVLLIFAPTLFNKLPHAALSAIVISACMGRPHARFAPRGEQR